jgi:regulator of replication initiation timing
VNKLTIGTLADGKPFTLPADLGDKKFAFLAQSKKGKTYGLGDILEELTDAHRPWSAFDPGSNLWGLRVMPDGKPSGLPIVVMGGDHGDLPLEKDAGERVAEAFIATPTCLVIDVSFESKTTVRKFVTDYCNGLMRTRAPGGRVVFFEEAPEFVPQRANYPGIQVCKAAVDRLVRIGGNFGYGTWLISQRSATIDKDVLSQCEALIVMGLTDTRDRKAVKEWMVAKDIDQRMAQCFEELGSLKPGEAWLWWPGEDRFERFTFRKRRTLHPREMQKLGLKPAAVELGDARLFVERLKKELTKTVATVSESKIVKSARAIAEMAKNPELKQVLVEANAGVSKALGEASAQMKELRDQVAELALENGRLKSEVSQQRGRADAAERRLEAVRKHLRPQYDALAALFQDLGEASPAGVVDRGPYQLLLEKARARGCGKMLEVLLDRPQLTKNQLGILAGVPAAKSTFRAYMAWLKRAGLVEVEGDSVKLRAV